MYDMDVIIQFTRKIDPNFPVSSFNFKIVVLTSHEAFFGG
jgi:hypothetical protein